MTMSEERPPICSQLIFPILLRPILHKVERHDPMAAQILMNAIIKAETQEPGLLLEIVNSILKRRDLTVNMTESLLRLQAHIPEFDDQKCKRQDEPFQELNRKTYSLKKILSRIPDEINDRKTFLETIKEIASAIKKLLDCVNEISNSSQQTSSTDRTALEKRKREFIKDSKKFSQTLKEFFRDGQTQPVFQSAAQLIYATNTIQRTVRTKFDLTVK
ncbi:programmed cell death protein 10-B-like [Oppia nitens]|uniref:programmed cell death protein 10-B-like n=1 Tax=Oppia nitens TaxID=1686743 RepID=UPI0023DB2A59|nr:programmed cell death protein 10-B-like [Oppia nitens]